VKVYLGFMLVALTGDSPLNSFIFYLKGIGHIDFCSKCESQIGLPFVNYYYDFIEEAEKRDLKTMKMPLVIKFGKVESQGIIGVCFIHNSGRTDLRRYVFINENYWNIAPKQTRKALMYHELAHCVLGVETHSDSGIMGEFMVRDPKEDLYEDFWKYVGENSENSVRQQ